MRLILHTFRKDARRLWPAVAVTWLMLGVLAHADRWRADWMPSLMEGWMNLLLSMAWACVAGLAVQEEPLVGDRNFWTTRPHRWPALLAAKLLFVLLAIHVPSFLADLYVLAARGFSPAPYLGILFAKQLLFLGALTLPAIALASVVRNFTHFVLGVFVIAAGIAILNGNFQSFPNRWWDVSELRHAVVRAVLALAAAVIVLVQYARRRVLVARVLAIAAALTAGSVSAYMPTRVEYALSGGSGPAPPRIESRRAVPDEAILRTYRHPPLRVVLIPVTIVSGLYEIGIPDVEIVAPNGVRVRSVMPIPNDPSQKIPLLAGLAPNWLVLRFTPTEWERVKNTPVDVVGSAPIRFYRLGETTTMSTTGTRDVPGVGKCTAAVVDDRFSESLFKLLCESPYDLPATRVRLSHAQSGREWQGRLNSSITFTPGPHQTFLSPLKRGQSFFRLADHVPTHPGDQWVVPTEYLPTAQLNVTPEIPKGTALARFQFQNLNLTDYLIK